MLKPLTPKVVEKTPGRGPRVRGVFPRYVSIGNAKKVDRSEWLIDGRVAADFDEDGELIGVAILG